jgi:hypothetical protein
MPAPGAAGLRWRRGGLEVQDLGLLLLVFLSAKEPLVV